MHSLVPIALAYVAAHYLTLLLFQGQAICLSPRTRSATAPTSSAPPNAASTTRSSAPTATWYWQVGFVVVGHVAALMLAHDRALVVYDDAQRAVRSQYWMLAVMVGFTSLALWLLSQANA